MASKRSTNPGLDLCFLAKGDISKAVLDFATEAGIDLVMIMTQQEETGGLRSTFFGADSVHVVNHSKIPVLSIKPKREYKSSPTVGSVWVCLSSRYCSRCSRLRRKW